MPNLSASTCATQNWMPSVLSVLRRNAGLNGPVPPRAFDDIGARVIDSTPHAIARSYAPAITPWATKCIACCDEPHWRSTLVAGTCGGSPPATQALRVTLQPCSPGLGDASADDVVDERRDRRRCSTSAFSDEAEQVGGMPPGERALALPDRRAHGVDDDGFADLHGRGS